MPVLEYTCQKCEILFEEVLLQTGDIKKYEEWYPCPQCGGRAEREKVSLTNFNFKAPRGQTQGSGVHGQSGVHDLDYPRLDKAIGRSANVKWSQYNDRKAARDKVRKESGNNQVSVTPDGKVLPSDVGTKVIREKAMGTFSKVKRAYTTPQKKES